MRDIWHLFVDDVRRLTGNVVSVIIVIGLVAIPSLFAWFNIAASWDPFGNMGAMRFAVANDDEGYQSDLIPVRVSIGAEVVDQLRADSQLDWTFTTRQDAIEGTKSGEYYAALVIPKDFSATMMTFFTEDAHHAVIEYYSNEKKNAVAPNLTGAGADEVAAQVNEMFAETLTGTALDIAAALVRQLDRPEARNAMDDFQANIADFAAQLNDTADSLATYRALTDTAQSLLESSSALVGQTATAIDDDAEPLGDARQAVRDTADALSAAAGTVTDALSASADGFTGVRDDLDTVFDDAQGNATATADALRQQSSAVSDQAALYRQLHDTLLGLPGAADNPDLTAAADALQRTADQLDTLATALTTAADTVTRDADAALGQREQIRTLIDQAVASVTDVSDGFAADIAPQVDQLTAAVRDASSVLDQDTQRLDSTVSTLDGAAADADATVADIRTMLDDTAAHLREAGAGLTTFHDDLADALTSGDADAVRSLLAGDASSLASALAAPVELDRKAVFPVANFGSGMAPYYTFIPLWTASILIALAVRTSLADEQRRRFRRLRPHQVFLGRFGVFALISLLQSTVSCAGSLLFLRVQAVHPLLFMLSGWVGGLVFAFFIYTMVVSFGNIGKAIGMLMLVFQVSGSAGSYPLQVLPGFMQRLSPFLPITHAINAMRAAIAGIYQNEPSSSDELRPTRALLDDGGFLPRHVKGGVERVRRPAGTGHLVHLQPFERLAHHHAGHGFGERLLMVPGDGGERVSDDINIGDGTVRNGQIHVDGVLADRPILALDRISAVGVDAGIPPGSAIPAIRTVRRPTVARILGGARSCHPRIRRLPGIPGELVVHRHGFGFAAPTQQGGGHRQTGHRHADCAAGKRHCVPFHIAYPFRSSSHRYCRTDKPTRPSGVVQSLRPRLPHLFHLYSRPGFRGLGRVGERHCRLPGLRALHLRPGGCRSPARRLIREPGRFVVPPLPHQHAVVEHDLSLRAGGDQRVMRHHDDGGALLMQLAEQVEHNALVAFVEIAGRFVGQHQFRAVDQRPRDAHTLLLAPGQLGGQMMGTLLQSHPFKRGHRLCLIDHRMIVLSDHHVLHRRQMRHQMELLEHQADHVLAHVGQLRGVQVLQSPPFQRHRTAAGRIQTPDDVHQRGFAGTGRADDRQPLSFRHGQVQIVDSVEFAVNLGDMVEFQ